MNTAIAITAIIMSTLALVTSLTSIVLVLAQRWSTHKIEWKPLTVASVETELEVEVEETGDDNILEQALKLNKKKKKIEEDPLVEEIQSSNF